MNGERKRKLSISILMAVNSLFRVRIVIHEKLCSATAQTRFRLCSRRVVENKRRTHSIELHIENRLRRCSSDVRFWAKRSIAIIQSSCVRYVNTYYASVIAIPTYEEYPSATVPSPINEPEITGHADAG